MSTRLALRHLIQRLPHYPSKAYRHHQSCARVKTIVLIACNLNHKLISRHSRRLIPFMNTSADSDGNAAAEAANRGEADGAEQLTAAANAAAIAAGLVATPAVKQWRPNPELMAQLTDMGISAVAAKKALYYSDNQSIESATNWLFADPPQDLDTPLELELNIGPNQPIQVPRGPPIGAESMAGGRTSGNSQQLVYKMVFIVNSSLEMGVGKIAAQVAHAALGMHQLLLQDELKYGQSLIRWSEFGETKIVLKGESTQHLIELEKHALSAGLPTYLVQDAGKTQVKAGSTTVLCLYGDTGCVDSVSGKLRLL